MTQNFMLVLKPFTFMSFSWILNELYNFQRPVFYFEHKMTNLSIENGLTWELLSYLVVDVLKNFVLAAVAGNSCLAPTSRWSKDYEKFTGCFLMIITISIWQEIWKLFGFLDALIPIFCTQNRGILVVKIWSKIWF